MAMDPRSSCFYFLSAGLYMYIPHATYKLLRIRPGFHAGRTVLIRYTKCIPMALAMSASHPASTVRGDKFGLCLCLFLPSFTLAYINGFALLQPHDPHAAPNTGDRLDQVLHSCGTG